MKVIAKTDIGRVRATNEDTYTFIKKDDNNLIAFVCDGMGGHLGGAFASSKTIEFLNDAFNKLISETKTPNIGVWLFETLQNANTFVYNQSIENENLKGMGTTVSGIVMINNEIYYAHIGDSRIYVYSDKGIEQITTDHTYVNTLLLNGLISYKSAKTHPKRHVLTNALGIKKSVSVDIGQIKLNDNDNILICSDGLHNMLDDKKLFKLANEDLDIQTKLDKIVDKALEAGGSDNITLILLEQ